MNINEYISSGIIESYVLGLADDADKAEFEKLCAAYPELLEERKKFEAILEQHALANGITPPPLAAGKHLHEVLYDAPASPDEGIAYSRKIINLPHKKLTWLAAASVIFLVGTAYLLYTLQAENKALIHANKQLEAKYTTVDSILNSLVNAKKILNNNNLSLVHMVGTVGLPASSANIYWDSASAAVYMIVQGLPALPADKQYQLWALTGGKPKSLGVFDATSNRVILKMKDSKNAEAFSITIEPKGGNTMPSPGKAQVTGKTKDL